MHVVVSCSLVLYDISCLPHSARTNPVWNIWIHSMQVKHADESVEHISHRYVLMEIISGVCITVWFQFLHDVSVCPIFLMQAAF